MDMRPQYFQNVTFYVPSNGLLPCIVRIDAAKVETSVAPHAQYASALHVNFVRKGKRKTESLTLLDPYLIIVPTDQAVDPDGMYLPAVNGASRARYSVTDSRWKSDFDEKLLAQKIPIIADYRNFLKDASSKADSIISAPKTSENPPSETEPDVQVRSQLPVLEVDEGRRIQAERSFFERNPALAERAKQEYGCACQVCGFDFAQTYGSLGMDFAEAHHINPLSERPPEEWSVDIQNTITDIAILCANCHRMIHRRKPALTIAQLKAVLSKH